MRLRQASHALPTLSLPARESMEALTNVDSLTGLHCRAAFEIDKTSSVFDRRVAGVIFIDIDYFSKINREHGRAIGDFVLAMQAERLRNTSPAFSSKLYRYEGDRFLQLLFAEQPIDEASLESIAKDIQQRLSVDIHLARQSVAVSCTITVASKSQTASLHQVMADVLFVTEEMSYQGSNQIHRVCSDSPAKPKVS